MRSVSLHPVRRTAPLRVAPVIALVAALVASAALAGCTSDGPDADPSPAATSATGSPTASAPPSGTPSPSGPPTLPAEAQGRSKAAAVAFVEHWIDVINYTGETLDTGPLRELSAPSCGPCAGIMATIDEVDRKRARIEGQQWTAISVEALSPTGVIQVRAAIDIADSREISRDGGIRRFDGGRALYVLSLAPKGNSWVVQDIRGSVA